MDDPTTPPDPTTRTASPPPRRRDEGRWASLITGFIVLGIGLWFFADHTLGLDMPLLRWSQLWPLIVIGVGAMILLGALRRERR